MRFVLLLCSLAASLSAAVPGELAAALETFRPDPPRGWSYTQTTVAEGKSTVERYDATKPEFDRWSLVQKDGRTPTPDETKHYSDLRSRRSRTGTAPRITEQFVLESIEVVENGAERATYRFRVRPGEAGDKVAPHLRATVVLHKPTRTIESIVLGSVEEFSPTIGVSITEMKTTMTYRPPAGETPAMPEAVATRMRGRAFWVKSLDADMSVTYSEYARAAKPAAKPE